MKKLGTIVMVIGIIGLIVLQIIKFSNQPILVTSSLGSGYMGGWSEQTVSMLNLFSVICGADIVLGLFLILKNGNK